MMKAKYITYKYNEKEISRIIVFSNLETHREIFKNLGNNVILIGAGFIGFNIKKMKEKIQVVPFCEGFSDSLNIGPNVEDHTTALIFFNLSEQFRYKW